MTAFDKVIKKLKNSNLSHANEIVRGLADGTIQVDLADLSWECCSCAELFETYRVRSKPRPNASAHSRRLRVDTLKLVDGLNRHKQERCYILAFSKLPNISYSLFVLTDLKELLGSYMSFDKRKTSEEEWIRIWEPKAAQQSDSPNG